MISSEPPATPQPRDRLAVCRKIVEAHGGAMVAAPAPGGGTTVGFSLPGHA